MYVAGAASMYVAGAASLYVAGVASAGGASRKAQGRMGGAGEGREMRRGWVTLGEALNETASDPISTGCTRLASITRLGV
jgi:hypothetical protein